MWHMNVVSGIATDIQTEREETSSFLLWRVSDMIVGSFSLSVKVSKTLEKCFLLLACPRLSTVSTLRSWLESLGHDSMYIRINASMYILINAECNTDMCVIYIMHTFCSL